jgi:hypothetical protein
MKTKRGRASDLFPLSVQREGGREGGGEGGRGGREGGVEEKEIEIDASTERSTHHTKRLISLFVLPFLSLYSKQSD